MNDPATKSIPTRQQAVELLRSILERDVINFLDAADRNALLLLTDNQPIVNAVWMNDHLVALRWDVDEARRVCANVIDAINEPGTWEQVSPDRWTQRNGRIARLCVEPVRIY